MVDVYDNIISPSNLVGLYGHLTKSFSQSLGRSTHGSGEYAFCSSNISENSELGRTFTSILNVVRQVHLKKTSVNIPHHRVRTDLIAKPVGCKPTEHVDIPKEVAVLKDNIKLSIIGMLSYEWKEEWGGELIVNGESIKYKPGRFIVFDASLPHNGFPPNSPIPIWRLVVNYICVDDYIWDNHYKYINT